MIDFYKHSFLSRLGKEAGSMNKIDYLNRVASMYDKCLNGVKGQIGKKEECKDNEIYL